MLGHKFSSRIAYNNTYLIIGKQPFLCLDEFHVHQNSGHTIVDHGWVREDLTTDLYIVYPGEEDVADDVVRVVNAPAIIAVAAQAGNDVGAWGPQTQSW